LVYIPVGDAGVVMASALQIRRRAERSRYANRIAKARAHSAG
jgi:hypothetical protein